MDPHSFIARAEAQRWLGIAEKLLMSHDLVGSKTFAIRARDSDPRLEAAEQILAITDTLLAAEKRVVGNNGNQQPDYYAILQLVRFVQETDHIADQYRRLAVILNPNQNRFPYSDQAFQLVNEAWTVLSNPLRKSMYDSELDFAPQQQQMNNLGFNLEQQHHQQPQHQQQHHQQHHQQQQHNFFSINQEIPDSPQTFQNRLQQSQSQSQQLQQHNFLSQPNPSVRDQDHLFQHQVQPFQVTSPPHQQTRPSPSPQPRTPIHSPPAAAAQPPFSWKQEHLQQQLQQKQIKQEQQQEQLKQQQLRDEQMKQQKMQKEQLKQQQMLQEQQKQQRMQEEQLKKQRMHEEQLKQQRLQEEQMKQQRMQEEQLKQQRLQQEEQLKQRQMQEEQLKQQQMQQEQLKQQQFQQEQLRLQHEQLKQQQMMQEQQKQQHMQQEQQTQQQQQQQQSLKQNAAPVSLPTQINSNNGVREEETVPETEVEAETETVDENVDDSPTFWTSCPYCFYMYEYPKLYADCTLRCDNCKRAFQAVRISSPPPIVEGQDAYFCCWGFIPVGVSMSHLQKENSNGTKSNWTPFSPLFDASKNVHSHLNECAAPKENTFVNKSSGPRIYFNDITNDVYVGVSESSDISDVEWDRPKKSNLKRIKKVPDPGFKERIQVLGLMAKKVRNGSVVKNLKHGIPVQKAVSALSVPLKEISKEVVGGNPIKQLGPTAKELGKLDLNVEFNNNEGEEPARRMSTGTLGNGLGEEDNTDGIGFFEGLDEFLSNLPILSVANEEKVMVA